MARIASPTSLNTTQDRLDKESVCVNDLDRRAGSRKPWLYAIYVACLLCLLGLAGGGWRAWQVERRGVKAAHGPTAKQRSGINASLEQYAADDLARALDDIHSLGFYWVRQRFPWQEIEPAQGVQDWAPWDAIVRAVSERGLGLIAVLDDPPAWALRHDPFPMPCVPPCATDAYARFASAFAHRYGDQIQAYQVWDEPNLSRSWGGGHAAPCGYAVLLEAAYEAIHDADPAAIVLGGGLAPTQAPGPGDLNDLVYLRQLYALGGDVHWDVLAVKPYGFWSGPEDRRVALDVLNVSRVVAVRELMRDHGDGGTPAWAVEWGWHVMPAGWAGDPPPWGTDTLAVQRPRIVGARERAGAEWPWLEVMCWAEYQPDLPPDDPRWGFALRNHGGAPTALYDVFRVESETAAATAVRGPLFASRWAYLLGLLSVAVVDAYVLWRRLEVGAVARRAWQRWVALPQRTHLAALVALAVLYVLTPWPEWVLLELCLAAALIYVHPRWALAGAVWSIPLFYAVKPLFGLRVSPSETLLYLAVVVAGVRAIRARRSPVPAGGWSTLDLVWGMWVAWGAVSLAVAPDPRLAWHEWRLCMLDPLLLYLILRVTGRQALPDGFPVEVAGLTWLMSGVAVSLVGIVQWGTGALVPAGSVGRVTGVYYSPNHLALYLDRIGPLALALVLCAGFRVRRRWAWGAVLVCGAALYLTYSRGAWLLGVPAALIVVAWCYRRRLRWWAIAAGLAALLLVASNVLVGRLAFPSGLLGEIRIPVWQSTWQMIVDHPWRGVGLDGFRTLYPRYMQVAAWTEPLLYHPHNVWLDAAVRLGMPGLALFAALVAFCVREVIRWGRAASGLQRALAVGCLAGLLAGLAHGLVDSGYFMADLAWSLALVAGMAGSTRR